MLRRPHPRKSLDGVRNWIDKVRPSPRRCLEPLQKGDNLCSENKWRDSFLSSQIVSVLIRLTYQSVCTTVASAEVPWFTHIILQYYRIFAHTYLKPSQWEYLQCFLWGQNKTRIACSSDIFWAKIRLCGMLWELLSWRNKSLPSTLCPLPAKVIVLCLLVSWLGAIITEKCPSQWPLLL